MRKLRSSEADTGQRMFGAVRSSPASSHPSVSLCFLNRALKNPSPRCYPPRSNRSIRMTQTMRGIESSTTCSRAASKPVGPAIFRKASPSRYSRLESKMLVSTRSRRANGNRRSLHRSAVLPVPQAPRKARRQLLIEPNVFRHRRGFARGAQRHRATPGHRPRNDAKRSLGCL